MKTLAAIPCHNEGLTIGSVVLKARKYVDLVLVAGMLKMHRRIRDKVLYGLKRIENESRRRE